VARSHAGGDGEEVPVVVAEDAARRRAEPAQPAQRRQRRRPAVDEVAEDVQMVARRLERHRGEQPLERVAAALEVADEVVHGAAAVSRRGAAVGTAAGSGRTRAGTEAILLRSFPAPAAPRAWTLPYCSS
jgi:hypothetical protein